VNREIRELESVLETLVRIIYKETQVLEMYREACAAPSSEMARRLCEHLAADEEAHLTKLRAAMDLVEKRLAEARSGSGE
jgi:rubrerythrin